MHNELQDAVKLVLASVISVALTVLSPLSSIADLPERPTPGLPQRPAAPDEDDKNAGNPNEQGMIGYIELHVVHTTTDLWAEVQWEDFGGGWHPVESWRGTVVNGNTRWWVEEKDFGKGPFRWVIYQQEAGPLLAVSQSFYLPDQTRPWLLISVPLER